MNRHLKVPAPQPEPIPTLSVEELAIAEDETSEAEIAAAVAEDDVDRVTEVAEVANDAILIVDETPEVGQVEQELVGAVGDMAVAGSDADPEEVISIPAAGEGDDLSVEGIVSALKSIWNAIVAAIKNMWVGLKHWLTTYFSSLEQNKKHAEKLIERLNGMKGWTANKGAMLTSAIADIYHYSGKSFLDLFERLGSIEDNFNAYVLKAISAHHDSMLLVGQALEYGYQNFDGMDLSRADKFTGKMTTHLKQYVHKLEMQKGKGENWETKPIAQMKVVAKGYNDNIDDAVQSTETQLALLSKIRFSVDQDTSFGSVKALHVMLDVTPDRLTEMVKGRLTFIEELLKFKGDQFKALEAQLEKVEKACEDMLGRFKEDNKEGQAFAKRLMPMTSAYANWATQPTAKLLSLTARHNKFWLSLYEMGANNFQKA